MSWEYRTPRCILCSRAATEQTSAGYLCPICAAHPESAYWKDRANTAKLKVAKLVTERHIEKEWQEYADQLGDWSYLTWQMIAYVFEKKLSEWEISYVPQAA